MPPSQYHELVVTPASQYNLILDFILQLPIDAVEELEASIVIRSEESLENIEWAISDFTTKLSSHLNEEIKIDFKMSQKENEDWVQLYRQGVDPVEVGNFYIHPSWHEGKDGFHNIIIDPALAFGSGHHATTATCLNLLSDANISGKSALDVGCGSGILSIAAAKLGADVDMCDSDPLAIVSAEENTKINGVTINNSWEGSAVDCSMEYDLVIANIVADVIVAIAPSLKKCLKMDGSLLLSGILDKYEGKVTDKFKEYKVLKRMQEGEWVSLLLQKEK